MERELKWYAVHTRPRWEKKVAHLLDKKGIEEYCPIHKVVRQWSDRKKLVLEPLITSYVFIRIQECDILKVKQTDGVINIVYWMGKPAVIKDDEIATIKWFLQDFEQVQIEHAKVNVNDRVRIIQGPLLSMEGNVLEVMSHTVKVLLPSLGYALIAQVEQAHIEKIFDGKQDQFIHHIQSA